MTNGTEINKSFEIVGFYPAKPGKNKTFLGTIHAYLIDADIDLRGINVFRKGKNYFYKFPEKFQLDPQTNRVERFPVMSFNNPDKQRQMIEFLRKSAPEIIQEEMKNHEKSTRMDDPNSDYKRSKSSWGTLDKKTKKTSKPEMVGGAME